MTGPMPWDADVPPLDPAVTGFEELYAYLERLRHGIGSVMGGASDAHRALHDQTAAVDQRVDGVVAAVEKLTTTVDKLAGRTSRLVIARAPLPTLAVGVEKPITMPWAPPPPVAPTSAVLLLEPTGSLLGQVTAAIKPDSVTATTVTVLLKAPLSIATAAGSVVVVGAYLA